MAQRGRGNRGNSRGGRGGGRGRGRGAARAGRGGGGPNFVAEHARPLTMWDEARNTDRHAGDRNAATRLRDVKMSFVAAGTLDPQDLLKPTEPPPEPLELSDPINPLAQSPTNQSSNDPEELDAEIPTLVEQIDLGAEESMEIEQSPDAENEVPQDAFVFDFMGDASQVPTNQKPVRIPSRSASVSSSASERIVFVPRNKKSGRDFEKKSQTAKSKAPLKTRKPEEIKPPKNEERRAEPVVEAKVVTTAKTVIQVDEPFTHRSRPHVLEYAEEKVKIETIKAKEIEEPDSFISLKPNSKKQSRANKKTNGDQAMDDYIKNMEEHGAENMKNLLRDLGVDDMLMSDETDSDDASADSDAIRDMKNELFEDVDDIEGLIDADDDANTDDGMGPFESVHRKRERPSGIQYLVKSKSSDVAVWVLAALMDSSMDQKIEEFEAMIAADSDESDEDEEGEEDPDAIMARLMQEQEFAKFPLDDYESFSRSLKFQTPKRRRSKYPDELTPNASKGYFPSATKTADKYEEFDLMDWERPSISSSKRKKGKGKLSLLDISDDEIRFQLENSWEADRQKKKARKAQREELRAEGKLGAKFNNTGKQDLSAKYPQGMTTTQAIAEMRSFVLSTETTLSLPPMDKFTRKRIHELGTKLNLKTKSVGKGNSRFPVLIRTSRTSLIDNEETIDGILRSRGGRSQFLPRMDVGRSGGRGGRFGRGGGGGGASGGAGRGEGEVVGAGAPELADDNRGRRMLEKMGFKAGMTLGVEGRIGISEPITAVVKRSRAGLGTDSPR
ncbi:hypothetical protein EDC01DRAFT_638985 [Geopyxis carbonaria]|nr:hypothetical protein EDC01DRAFT_638985 [Geopyxis carbonaria]